MLLGGTVLSATSPDRWEAALDASHFRAVTAPFTFLTPPGERQLYLDILQRRGVQIAEVGVWRNTLSPDPDERAAATDYAIGQLALADELGIDCCVNIVGSAGRSAWDGPDPDNFSAETYDRIIASIRAILDSVKPDRAYYCIEPMPWMVPDGPDEYLRLIRDVDRPHFAAHMDFVNMINCPRRYLAASAFIDECFCKLAPWIKSTHIKDVHMDPDSFTTLLYEVPPGRGDLDYVSVLRSMARYLPAGAPILLEHMDSMEDYAAAYAHVSQAAAQAGVSV